MKKKTKIIITVILAFILLFPFNSGYYKDGGTHFLNAVIWGVTKHRELTLSGDTEGRSYGTSIRLLCFEVYDNTHFITEEEYRQIENNK